VVACSPAPIWSPTGSAASPESGAEERGGDRMSTPLLQPLATDAVRFVASGGAWSLPRARGGSGGSADLRRLPTLPRSPRSRRRSPTARRSCGRRRRATSPRCRPRRRRRLRRRLRQAQHVTRIAVLNQRLSPVTIEPRGARAIFAGGRLTLQPLAEPSECSSRCEDPRLPPEQVRVTWRRRRPLRHETLLHAEDVVCAYAARRLAGRCAGRRRASRSSRPPATAATSRPRRSSRSTRRAHPRPARAHRRNVGAFGHAPAAIIN